MAGINSTKNSEMSSSQEVISAGLKQQILGEVAISTIIFLERTMFFIYWFPASQSSQRSKALFDLQGTRHACGSQTYMQVKHLYK